MTTKKIEVILPMNDPVGKPIEIEMVVSTVNGVIQTASLCQVKTWKTDEEIALTN